MEKTEYFEHKMHEKWKKLTPKCLQKEGDVHERIGTSYAVCVFVQESLHS